MTFTTLEKVAPGRGPRRIGRVTARRVGTTRQIAFTLSPDISDATGLTDRALVDVQLGTGSDAGFLKAQPSTNIAARKMLKEGGSGTSPRFTLAAKVIPALIPEKSIDLPWRIEDGALVIDIRPLEPATADTIIAGTG